MNRPSHLARRTEGKRTRGRSARVLEAVLDAAAEELGRVGFGALRIEDVAIRSGVNKTTVYRRWPTKLELVTAVLERENITTTDFDLGTLLADVRATLDELRTRLYSFRQRGIMRFLIGERAQPEVAQLTRSMRERQLTIRQRMFERAIARGELAPTCDPALLVEIMSAPLVARIIHMGGDADDAFLDTLAHVICAGAAALQSPH
ncbi:MAG: TetR/AcrR family transcriptional regulator [Polyangiales bacterium]